jgi:hypothetical protein
VSDATSRSNSESNHIKVKEIQSRSPFCHKRAASYSISPQSSLTCGAVVPAPLWAPPVVAPRQVSGLRVSPSVSASPLLRNIGAMCYARVVRYTLESRSERTERNDRPSATVLPHSSIALSVPSLHDYHLSLDLWHKTTVSNRRPSCLHSLLFHAPLTNSFPSFQT